MKRIFGSILASAALASLATFAASSPASAQQIQYGPYGVPLYETWQPQWNHYNYDRHHVMLGIVTTFSPYRLSMQRRNGQYITIDLKNGTVIRPTGATPMAGERAAVVGYWSNGTFIANRVILRPGYGY